MTRSWRLPICAAVFLICAGADAADAQTVMVRSAPPAAAAEVVFGDAAGKATVDAVGDATVELENSPAANAEVAVAIYSETCGPTVRVRLVARTAETPVAPAGCQRRQVSGFFVMRRGTSLVIDLAEPVPTVRIRQGSIPPAWLVRGPLVTRRLSPRGLVVYGGGGLGDVRETFLRFCGNALTCSRETTKLTFTGGAAYWLTRWLGAEASFLKPLTFPSSGFDSNYEFTTHISTRVATVSVLGGLSIGSVRFYGRLGAGYHRAQVRTVEVIYNRTIDVGDTVETFPGNEQTFTFETVGWGRIYGAGVEAWLGENAAAYFDASFIPLKGENADSGGVRTIDDRALAVVAGLKFHLGFRR